MYIYVRLLFLILANDLFAVKDDHSDILHRGVDLFPDIADGSYAVNHTACLLRCLSKTSAECKKVTSCDKAYNGNGCWRAPDIDTPQASSTCSFNERLSKKAQ